MPMPKTESKSINFSQGVRGKYYDRAMAGSNIVLLDPDLVETYPDSKAVNAALRSLKEVAERTLKPRRKKIA